MTLLGIALLSGAGFREIVHYNPLLWLGSLHDNLRRTKEGTETTGR